MVLRDANLHKMVDGCHGRNLDIGPMPHHHPVPIILQFPRRIRQKPGKTSRDLLWRPARLSRGHSRQRLTVFGSIVLAPPNHLPLLWPPLPRPPLPRLLPPALLPPPRRILRPLPRALLLATPLRHQHPPLPLPHALDALPRLGSQQLTGLYLVAAQPGDEIELLGAAGVYGAVPAVGVDGVQFGAAWERAEGRDLWRYCGTWYALFHENIGENWKD